jgi:hypothetical protein
MQLGDRPGALTVMESGGVEWDKAEPRWQAVYAAVLAANQQRSAARRMAAGIDQSRLKLLERALLDGIVSK